MNRRRFVALAACAPLVLAADMPEIPQTTTVYIRGDVTADVLNDLIRGLHEANERGNVVIRLGGRVHM